MRLFLCQYVSICTFATYLICTQIMRLIFICITTVLLLGLNACKDACEDTYCENGGGCYDGKCECPEGFGGDHCETELCSLTCVYGERVYDEVTETCSCDCDPGYIGTFCSVSIQSTLSGTFVVDDNCKSNSYFITISNGYYPSIRLSSFAGVSSYVTATVNGNLITINSQNVYIQGTSHTISGNGNIANNGVLTINYQLTNGPYANQCIAVCTKLQ